MASKNVVKGADWIIFEKNSQSRSYLHIMKSTNWAFSTPPFLLGHKNAPYFESLLMLKKMLKKAPEI